MIAASFLSADPTQRPRMVAVNGGECQCPPSEHSAGIGGQAMWLGVSGVHVMQLHHSGLSGAALGDGCDGQQGDHAGDGAEDEVQLQRQV